MLTVITISLFLKFDVRFILYITYCTCIFGILPYPAKVIQGCILVHFFPQLNLWFNFLLLPHFLAHFTKLLHQFQWFILAHIFYEPVSFCSLKQQIQLLTHAFLFPITCGEFFSPSYLFFIFTFCLSNVMLHRRGVTANSTAKDEDFRC